jgi:NADPH-dependent 2,4-dienoyl-CoA reductase/sulfur reductase-like enzyme
MLEMRAEDDLWREVMNELRSGLIELKERYGAELVDEATVKEIKEDGVVYEKDGVEKFIAADTVVTSCGLRPNREAVAAWKELMPEVTVIGDARQSGKIYTANHDAFDVAVEI